MSLNVFLLGLALAAVVFLSRAAPFALLAGRDIHPRLRKLIKVLPGCAIAGFLTIWALPEQGQAWTAMMPIWLGALAGLALCFGTGRILLSLLVGLSIAAAGSLLV